MAIDRSLPIGPLSPELKQALGEPESILVSVTGGLDVRANAWLLGKGEVGSKQRGTRVRIWVTPGGTLLANVTVWHGATATDPFSGESSHGQFHETPAQVLEWLIRDGNGKLGQASKEAWKQACASFPPMHGMDANFIP